MHEGLGAIQTERRGYPAPEVGQRSCPEIPRHTEQFGTGIGGGHSQPVVVQSSSRHSTAMKRPRRTFGSNHVLDYDLWVVNDPLASQQGAREHVAVFTAAA